VRSGGRSKGRFEIQVDPWTGTPRQKLALMGVAALRLRDGGIRRMLCPHTRTERKSQCPIN